MTTPKQFYETLLDEIAVARETMREARDKRDELGRLVVAALPDLQDVRSFGTGAVAQGTQTKPLNDVDVVVEAAAVLPAWKDSPRQALVDIAGRIAGDIGGRYDIGTHAIKLQLEESPFTADIVFGCRRPEGGLLIPHCPPDEPHRWIATDPEQHRELVLERNRPYGRAVFSRQIRILKQFNAWCRYADDANRKPLASFHVTALALHLLGDWEGHDHWSVRFFEGAAKHVRTPLPSPTGVGHPLVARDPDYAEAMLLRAAAETRRALTAPAEAVEEILRGVFGDPKLLEQIVENRPVVVKTNGAFAPAAIGATSITRAVKPVRSYGEDGTT